MWAFPSFQMWNLGHTFSLSLREWSNSIIGYPSIFEGQEADLAVPISGLIPYWTLYLLPFNSFSKNQFRHHFLQRVCSYYSSSCSLQTLPGSWALPPLLQLPCCGSHPQCCSHLQYTCQHPPAALWKMWLLWGYVTLVSFSQTSGSSSMLGTW